MAIYEAANTVVSQAFVIHPFVLHPRNYCRSWYHGEINFSQTELRLKGYVHGVWKMRVHAKLITGTLTARFLSGKATPTQTHSHLASSAKTD